MSRLDTALAVAEGLQPRADHKERLTLRQLRERAGLSIKQLEAAIGIPRGTLSGIETGTRTPTPSQLHQLSAFYGVPADGWRFVVLATVEVEA